ncbi:MAG: acyl-CoA dehydrogenase [Cytophagales bacterium]|nr:acyl-CoA dehydrogenase [Cytophagales bacterium]
MGSPISKRIILEQFILQVEATKDTSCKTVLKKLCNLFALSQIDKNKGWYLEQGYMEGVKYRKPFVN